MDQDQEWHGMGIANKWEINDFVSLMELTLSDDPGTP